jgi:hypothetical protein
MYRDVKTVVLTKVRNPEALDLINDLASLQKRKAHDSTNQMILELYPDLIKAERAKKPIDPVLEAL